MSKVGFWLKGQETMSLFMSENIQKCRAAIEEMQSQAIQLFKDGAQVGNDHAIDGNAANFVVSAAAIGTYTIKVKKSDNSVATPGYSIVVAAYSAGGGGGMDQN